VSVIGNRGCFYITGIEGSLGYVHLRGFFFSGDYINFYTNMDLMNIHNFCEIHDNLGTMFNSYHDFHSQLLSSLGRPIP